MALKTRTRCYSFDQSVRKINDRLVLNMMNKNGNTFPERVEEVEQCSGYYCRVGTHIHTTIISTFSDRGI